MKRIFIVLLLLAVVTSASALSYRHSIGVNLGSMNGISYKGYVGKNLHFVIQADLYYQMCYSPRGYINGTLYTNNNGALSLMTDTYKFPATLSQAVMASPSFMYQAKIEKWDAGTMNWYAGGSVALGCTWGGEYDELTRMVNLSNDFAPWFKCGAYAIGGIEFCFEKAPLVLGLDLKPGVAANYYLKKVSDASIGDMTSVTFDWGASLTLRYCFGK